jgi:CheY-like chemotaxis protein
MSLMRDWACDTERMSSPASPPPRPPKPASERTAPVPPELRGAVVAPSELEDLTDDAIEDVPAPPDPIAKGPKSDSLTVLVVEDDESIRSLVIRALGTQYRVYEATDGQQAVDILDAIPPPACIISDIMMPRLDGIGLAKKIKTTPALKGTPIIFLTAKNAPLDVVQGINAGARHYLAKPFKMKELLDKVASVVSNTAKR